MQKDELLKLLENISERAKVEKPTYLGYFQAFDSLVLNQRNKNFFYNKQIRVFEAKDFHGFLLNNWFTNETIVNLWYLFHLMDGVPKAPLELTKYERVRIIFVITKLWQDTLPKYETRLEHLSKLKDIKKLDLFTTINELIKITTPKEDEIHKKLKQLEKELHPEISDEELLDEFINTEKALIGGFEKIRDFQNEVENLTGIISEIFQHNIFLGYKKGLLGLPLEYVIKNFPKTLISLYVFKLEIDRGMDAPKVYYKRLESLKKSLTTIVDKMKKALSGPDAEDIGWIDTVLIISPAVTFLNNLEKHMRYYRKLFKSHIEKKGQRGRFYEKLFIQSIYMDIKVECKASKIHKKPMDILMEVLLSLSAVLKSYNEIYETKLEHLSYDYDNIQKIVHSKLTKADNE